MTLVDFFAAAAQLLGLLVVFAGMAAMRMDKPPAVQPLRLVRPVSPQTRVSRRRRS